MSNHYQALKQLVAELPENTQRARLEAYGRAHRDLITNMKTRQPPIAEEAIAFEAQALKQAAVRIEGELTGEQTQRTPLQQALPQQIQSQQINPVQLRLAEAPHPKSGPQQTAAQHSAMQQGVAQQTVFNHGPQVQPPPSGQAAPDQAAAAKSGAEGSPAAAGKPPAAAAPPARREFATGDLEFLPAALEILETPPSPVRIRMMLAICSFVVIALAWAYFGYFDIIAIAQGKLQPTGRVNVIQPVETGKVRAIKVSNGVRVKEGDIVVEMDPSDAQADVTAQTALLGSLDAEIARRKAAGELIIGRDLAKAPAIDFPATVSAEARQREERVLASDVAQISSVVAALTAQRAQKRAELARITGTVEALQNYVNVLRERVDMRQTLVDRNVGARANVIDALEKYNEQMAQLATQRGQLNEVRANLDVIEKEIEKAFQSSAADNNQRLLSAQRQQDETAQRLEKAKVRLGNTYLRAPNSGVVQAVSVVNTGQVVAAGEQIMRVVPDNLGLEIEGYIQNKDIGFLREGQKATIKIDSFPFTKYGTIEAVVTKIARDAIPLPEAGQNETNPAQSQRLTGVGGAQRTQNLVYQVTLRPEQTVIGAGGEKVQLMPGMTVAIEVKTGTRRIISYVLTPLVETGSTAMRER